MMLAFVVFGMAAIFDTSVDSLLGMVLLFEPPGLSSLFCIVIVPAKD